MDKKLETILKYKKDKYSTYLNVLGNIFNLNVYFMIYNLMKYGSITTFIFQLMVVVILFLFMYSVPNKFCPLFNKNIFHATYQFCCAFVISMFACFPVEIMKYDFTFFVIISIVCWIIHNIFIHRFEKTEIKNLFTEEYIKSVEKELEK